MAFKRLPKNGSTFFILTVAFLKILILSSATPYIQAYLGAVFDSNSTKPIGYYDKQQLAAGGTTPFVEVAISRFLFPKKILTA